MHRCDNCLFVMQLRSNLAVRLMGLVNPYLLLNQLKQGNLANARRWLLNAVNNASMNSQEGTPMLVNHCH